MCLVVRLECTMEGEGMRREALTLAIEALSWMDLRRINGRFALRRTARQLGIRDESVLRQAFRLIMEATRRRNAVDHIATQALGREDLEGLNLGVRSFLRIYASEVKYGERPFQEVVGIAALAREILGSKVLAPVEEALDLIPHLEVRFEGLPEDEATALRTFHPAWYVRYCAELLGRKEALLLLQAPDPPTYVRINSLKGVDEEVLDGLRLEGAELEGEPGLEHVYRVADQKRPLNLLESHREGLFTLQDKASALAGVVAAPEPGMTVLDVCAAPGAKTSHLAQLMGNQGRILSLDSSERRLETWKREMARLGVENAEPVLGDARKPGAFPDVEADLVIVDPPCTGTGTFNHIPSGKWRLSRRSIDKMAFIQRKIMENCADRVSEGGSLVYCTCSITLEENEMVVQDFLRKNHGFNLVEAEPQLGLSGHLGQTQAQRLYPHIHESNGFYIAKLLRRD
jgi:16S rRNA (cytosine967-C5)-methyltransferase